MRRAWSDLVPKLLLGNEIQTRSSERWIGRILPFGRVGRALSGPVFRR